MKVIEISTRLLISGDLAFFATVVEKINRSGCLCHWCYLSPFEWEYIPRENGILRTIDLMKNLFMTKLLLLKQLQMKRRVLTNQYYLIMYRIYFPYCMLRQVLVTKLLKIISYGLLRG